MTEISRRSFVRQTSGALAGISTLSALNPQRVLGANNKINLGCIGVGGGASRNDGNGGMGENDMSIFIRTERANVVGICDLDSHNVERSAERAEEMQDKAPKTYSDYRKLLENEKIDAVLVATPDHWHTIVTMDACAAGKDVYVEKPCSHNITEALEMNKAAEKHKRIVQHGTQQRSGKQFQMARDYVRSGKLGKIGLVRTWVSPGRASLGKVPNSKPPETLDYDFWCGPAEKREFNTNLCHPYNWRFAWDFGTGDMGNWGVHWLDIAIWVMDLGWPTTVSSSGGNFVHRDAKETPDTQVALYNYPDKELTLVWEQRLWTAEGFFNKDKGVAFYGDKQTLVVNRECMEVYEVGSGDIVDEATGDDVTSINGLSINHMNNFIDSCGSRKPSIANIREGHLSAAVSLLGNVAFLAEKTVHYDPKTNKTGDPETDKLLERTYRGDYQLPTV